MLNNAKNKTVIRLNLLILLLFSMAKAEAQTDNSPIFSIYKLVPDVVSGRWHGVLNTPAEYIPLIYDLKVNGKKLSGNAVTDQAEPELYDGSVNGENISFKILLNGQVMPHEGSVIMDTLRMKITMKNRVYESKFLREKPFYYDRSPRRTF